MVTDKNDQMDEFLDEGDDQADSFVEGDWDSYDDPNSPDLAVENESEKVVQKKKKSGLSAKLLIAAVMVIGGGVIFLQMGQGSQPSGAAPETEQMTAQQAWSPSPVEVTAPSAPPMPAPIEQVEEAPPSQPENIQDSPRMMDETGAQATIRMPKADILLKSPASDAPLSPQQPLATGPDDAAVVQLSDKIDQLMERLDKIEGDMVAVGDLKESVRVLEKKVASLSSVKESAGKKPVAEQEKSISSAVVPVPTVAPVPEIASSRAPVVLQKAPVEENSRTSWILKGAQPGRAMVSRVGENDMRTVEIGSVLAGIGQVTDISYQDGRWVVTGTKGRITQ